MAVAEALFGLLEGVRSTSAGLLRFLLDDPELEANGLSGDDLVSR